MLRIAIRIMVVKILPMFILSNEVGENCLEVS